MENTYLTALKESLEKKIEVLEKIHIKDEEQLEIAKAPNFRYDDFDKNAEEKGVLIYKLNKLDDGFESLYEKVRDELTVNKSAYAEEIKTMQALITRITDLSTKIQAEEARNKAAVERAIKAEREKIKTQRSGIKAIQSYTKTMKGSKDPYSGI